MCLRLISSNVISGAISNESKIPKSWINSNCPEISSLEIWGDMRGSVVRNQMYT